MIIGNFEITTERDREGSLILVCYQDLDDPSYSYSEHSDGLKVWFKNGAFHSYNDDPALIYKSGTKEWYYEGIRHRPNGLPAIDWSNGAKCWYEHGRNIAHYNKKAGLVIFNHRDKKCPQKFVF